MGRETALGGDRPNDFDLFFHPPLVVYLITPVFLPMAFDRSCFSGAETTE